MTRDRGSSQDSRLNADLGPIICGIYKRQITLSVNLSPLGVYSIVRERAGEVAALAAFECLTRKSGGAERDRTDDLRLAKPALSQLSYSPEGRTLWKETASRSCEARSLVVGLARLELATSPLSGVRSNHLSYRP